MRTITKSVFGAILALSFSCQLYAQPSSSDLAAMTLVSRENLPRVGTFWLQMPSGMTAPLPCPPGDLPDAPIYALPNGQYFVDASTSESSRRTSRSTMSASFSFGGGGGGDEPSPLPDTRRNYAKFAAQTFSILDTNVVCAIDTNLCHAVSSFPNVTSTSPSLQIKLYGTNSVIIRANHFDYSAETRDFALLVCDKAETALWKNIQLSGSSDTQDGWLIQGAVPALQVADPMYFLVSNISGASAAFFRAIPYGGPQIQLTGAQPYATVSNSITIHATLTDLSGTTLSNQQLVVTVNGLAPRWSLGTSNNISLNTTYAASGVQEIEVMLGSIPVVNDPQNPAMDTQLEYDTTVALPLDFENPVFLISASDMCSPDIGTNYILFGLAQPDQVSVTIREPSSGRVVMTYSNHVNAGTLAVAWNFTEANGTTPYTNDTYAVHFVAYDPTTLDITNQIDRKGVRVGGGVIITYAEENPNEPTGTASYLNGQADTWIAQTLAYLYDDIYDPWGLTEYYPYDIGYLRNYTAGYVDTPAPQNGWREFMAEKLGTHLYSDTTIGPAHGTPVVFGANGGGIASSRDIQTWATAAGTNWRMRKVALWSCDSGANGSVTNVSTYPDFPSAFGIRTKALQDSTFMRKNAGLFFAGHVDQGWYVNSSTAQTTVQAEVTFDELWVAGPNAYPGGCDPSYAFSRILTMTLGQYPVLKKWNPVLAGYYWLPYTDLFDDEIMGNNLSHIH